MSLRSIAAASPDRLIEVETIGNLNFWVNSSQYNIIEMTHHIWILMAVDYLTINK